MPHSKHIPHTYHSTLSCDAEGGACGLGCSGCFSSWKLDFICNNSPTWWKLLHKIETRFYIPCKNENSNKKKRERKTNRLVTHLAQVEKWKQLWWPKGRLYKVGNCRFSGHLTECACRGTNSMIKQVCMLDHIYTLWLSMCVHLCACVSDDLQVSWQQYSGGKHPCVST